MIFDGDRDEIGPYLRELADKMGSRCLFSMPSLNSVFATVVRSRKRVSMVWIHTTRVLTIMMQVVTIGDGAIGRLIKGSVCKNQFSIDRGSPIPVLVLASLPVPATSFGVNDVVSGRNRIVSSVVPTNEANMLSLDVSPIAAGSCCNRRVFTASALTKARWIGGRQGRLASWHFDDLRDRSLGCRRADGCDSIASALLYLNYTKCPGTAGRMAS